MSGIEIAGVILSLWPVITDLASAYKDAKTGEDLKKVIKRVTVSEVLYKNQLRALLLCDDQLSEEDRSKLLDSLEDAEAAWKQPHVQRRLRECLGDETCDSIDTTLTEILSAMQVLETSLRKGEVDATSFRGRVKGAVWHTRTKRPNSSFQVALERLDRNVTTLRSLLSVSETPLRHQRSRVEKGRARRVSEVRQKRIAAIYSNTFYEAIKAGFRECNCVDGHDTSLRVNCDDFFRVVLRASSDDGESDAGLSLQTRATFDTAVSTLNGGAHADDEFPLLEEVESPRPIVTEKSARKPESTTSWSSRSRIDSVTSSQQSQHAVQFTFSADDPRARGSSLRSLLDLCMLVRDLRPTPPNSLHPKEPLSSFGTLRRGESIFTARGDPEVLSPVTIASLDDRLAHLCQARPKKRVEIAHNLAFAVVQFWSTQWIDDLWTWRNFSVKEDPQKIQLFITRRIMSAQAERSLEEKPPKFWRLITEPMLVRLGFALIELAIGKRLSDWREDNEEDEASEDFSEDEKDYDTALKVLESRQLEDDLSRTYQGVAAACLRCEVPRDGHFVALTRRATTFQSDVDMHILQPLHHYFESNWGTVQA